jgi:hypothetical protein
MFAMMVRDQEYQNHKVFAELTIYIDFYDELANSVFTWVSQGIRGAIGNIDSYIYSSIRGTLKSISAVLRNGQINDAYALLRKFNDSAIINIYSNLYLEDHYGLSNLVVEEIDGWIKGKTRLPEYRIMSQYIRASARVAAITKLFAADQRYRRVRDRCNDHTHYNFYRNVLLNDGDIHLPWRGEALDGLANDLRDVFILHVAYLLYVKEHYMMSTDHRDYLECGLTPEPDSQYWVAPFIQEVFDHVLSKHRPDVAATLKNHTSMHLS